MKKAILIIMAIAFTIICLRLAYVQYNISHAPLQITDIADAGYTQPGDYGHGNLYSKNGEKLWYIYDIPAPEIGAGKVRKICAYSLPPHTQIDGTNADIDFFYIAGRWYKIRSGDVTITGKIFIGPANTKWKGWLSSKTVFPIDKPDFPYKLKILISKFLYATLSPEEYVLGLKQSNLSCQNIPGI